MTTNEVKILIERNLSKFDAYLILQILSKRHGYEFIVILRDYVNDRIDYDQLDRILRHMP